MLSNHWKPKVFTGLFLLIVTSGRTNEPEGFVTGTPSIAVTRIALCRKSTSRQVTTTPRPPSARVIGRSTVECLQSGIVFGTVAMVDGMVARIRGEVDGAPAVIATGGLAGLICQFSAEIDEHEPLLTLEGLRIVHELNARSART